MNDLIRNAETINKLLSRYGVKFGIYKNGEFREQLFPFDPIPRIICTELFFIRHLRQKTDRQRQGDTGGIYFFGEGFSCTV